MSSHETSTRSLTGVALGRPSVRRFQLVAQEGTEAGARWMSDGDVCSIGSHPSNHVVLKDRTVSRFHGEIRIEKSGPRLHDLGSRNGTQVDGVKVTDCWLRDGSLIRIGHCVLQLRTTGETSQLDVSERTRFGSLVGRSVAMRAAFALLERAAATASTVLIEAETGTGKEGAAASLHDASSRSHGPFVVIDCGAIHENLLEAELFGHERGAFTGAASRRIGAFEEAHGGTVFLDEIGELDVALQPKLLRVLERREIKRVGGTVVIPVDVRVVAATNRDLRAEVNEARFRADLYYRLAVVRVRLPALRERPEDIPLLVAHLLETMDADGEARRRLLDADFLGRLQGARWPGNVRQLRNYLERCLVLREPAPLEETALRRGVLGTPSLSHLPYTDARRLALDDFEATYVRGLLDAHQGHVSQAARAAHIDRVYLYRLMRRHGLHKK